MFIDVIVEGQGSSFFLGTIGIILNICLFTCWEDFLVPSFKLEGEVLMENLNL